MKIAAHPLIVAVALGLLNPSALAESNDEEDTQAQRRAQAGDKREPALLTKDASIASLEAQQSEELESVLDELNRSLGNASFDPADQA